MVRQLDCHFIWLSSFHYLSIQLRYCVVLFHLCCDLVRPGATWSVLAHPAGSIIIRHSTAECTRKWPSISPFWAGRNSTLAPHPSSLSARSKSKLRRYQSNLIKTKLKRQQSVIVVLVIERKISLPFFLWCLSSLPWWLIETVTVTLTVTVTVSVE